MDNEMRWQLQDAKNRFSEVVDLAVSEGAQTVTRHGRDTVVILSVDDYRRLRGADVTFKSYLMHGPSLEGVDLARDTTPDRGVDLEAGWAVKAPRRKRRT
jgi:antitoxin Phd